MALQAFNLRCLLSGVLHRIKERAWCVTAKRYLRRHRIEPLGLKLTHHLTVKKIDEPTR